jgi:hypothetical protein
MPNDNGVCLKIRVVTSQGDFRGGTVDLEFKLQNAGEIRRNRGVDASKEIDVSGLQRSPQGLYQVTVTPTDVFKPSAQFVTIPASGFIVTDFKIDDKVVGSPPGDFQKPPLIRDVNDSRHIDAATPRALKFSVSYARQLTPSNFTIADTVMMFGGLIRYGQDNDSDGEDLRNESSDYSELDGIGNNSPRTVMLQLRGPDLADPQFAGSAAVSALGDSYFTWQDTFGTATDNAAAFLTQPTENGNQLDHDLWFMSDVVAERTTGDTSQVNRSSYQATVLLKLK